MPYADIEKRKAARRKYYAANKEKVKAWNRKWYERYPEKAKRLHAEYYQANKQSVLLRTKKWQKDNADKERARHKRWREQNRAKGREMCRDWAKRNRPRVAALAAKKRARLRGAPTESDRSAYNQFVEHVRGAKRIRCYWCKKPVPKDKRHIDHIIPLAKGGADAVVNLCCACEFCNCSKHDHMPEAFSGQFEIVFPVRT